MQDSIWYIKLVFPRHLILNRLRIRHYKNCCYVSIYLEFTVYTFDRLRIRHYVSIYLGLTIHKEILSNYIGIRCLVKHMFPFSMVIWVKKKLKIFLKIYFEWGFRFWSFTYTNQEEPFGCEVPDHHVKYCPFSRAMGVYMGGHWP